MNKELEKVCFPVEKTPSWTIMKDAATEFNNENSYAIQGTITRVDADGKVTQVTKVLNFCSDMYNLLPNKRILEPLEKVMNEKVALFQKAHGEEHNIELDIYASSPKDSQFFVTITPVVTRFAKMGEIIKPSVRFTNSYDGHLKARATGGLVRYLVDAKGNVSKNYSGYLKGYSFLYEFKHSNELIYTMDEVAALVDQYFVNFNKIENLIRLMKQTDFNVVSTAAIEKFTKKMIEKSGITFPNTYVTGLNQKGERIIDTTVMSVVERARYEMKIFDEQKLNLWTLYNAMNYVLMNAKSDMPEKVRVDSDNKLLAFFIGLLPVESSLDSAKEQLLSPDDQRVQDEIAETFGK